MVKLYYLDVPYSIMRKYKHGTLSGDVIFVNRTPFMLTVARLLLMGTCKYISSIKSVYTLKAIKSVVQLYTKRGFKIVGMFLDGEFDHMSTFYPLTNTYQKSTGTSGQ